MDDGLVSMLGALKELEIKRCIELKSLVGNEKEMEGMFRLQKLSIRYCNKLVSFGWMRLPSSLKKMTTCNCDALEWLPEGFMMNESSTCEYALERLSISDCPCLTTFPNGRFPNQLKNLEIHACKSLESIPEYSDSIKVLTITDCDHLRSSRFPPSLVRLRVENLSSLTFEKGKLISSDSENVRHRSPSPESNVEDTELKLEKMFVNSSTSLEYLVISSLNLRRLPKIITSFERMKYLAIMGCKHLRWLPRHIQELTGLVELTIINCPNLEMLAGQNFPCQLKYLYVKGWKVIEGLFDGGFSFLASLMHLRIDGGMDDFNLQQEAPVFLPKLQILQMYNFGNLENLDTVFQLPSSIEKLVIEKCAKLRGLPIQELSSNLGHLSISGCPLLKNRCFDRKGEYWPLLSHIPRVEIDYQELSPFTASLF